MSRKNRTGEYLEFAGGYVARPKRTEVRDGTKMSYWTVRYRRGDGGYEKTLGWFSNKRRAEKAFQTWYIKHVGATPKPAGRSPLSAVLDAYIASVKRMADKRPATRSNRIYVAKQLAEFVKVHDPELRIGGFTDEVFEKYLGWLKDRYSPQTVLNALIGARVVLRWAKAAGFVDQIPKQPKFTLPKGRSIRVSAEEYKRLYEVADGRLKLLIWLLSETGLRIQEALSLRADRLDQSGPWVVITKLQTDTFDFSPKTPGSHRKVPVTKPLMKALLAALPENEQDRIFDSGTNTEYAYWRHRMNKACTSAGLDRITFSRFRNSRSLALIQAGVPTNAYQQMLGHSAKTALEHYAIANDHDLKAAFQLVQEKLASDDGGG